MALFQTPDKLPSIHGGMIDYAVVQQPPDGTAPTGLLNSASSTGDLIFTIRNDGRYIMWSDSTLDIRLHFSSDSAGLNAVLYPTTPNQATVCCADNWPACLWQSARIQFQGTQIEQALQVPQLDTALTYSSVSGNYLKTFGSVAGIGRTWQERLSDTSFAASSGNTTPNQLTAQWRPPLSLWTQKQPMLGGEWRLTLTWNPTAVAAMQGESAAVLAPGTTGAGPPATGYYVTIDSLFLNLATCKPDPRVGIPKRRLIDLTPCQASLFPITGASPTWNQQSSIQPSTFRILVGFQHINAGNPNPANLTSQTLVTSNAAVWAAAPVNPVTAMTIPLTWFNDMGLNNFYISISQLGKQMPLPMYAIQANKRDAGRAYVDWLTATQGQYTLQEGSIPLGSCDVLAPVKVAAAQRTIPLITSLVGEEFNGLGGPNWLGNKFLLAFNIVKEEAAKLSVIEIYATFFGAGAQSVWPAQLARNMYMFAIYSASLGIDYDDRGNIVANQFNTSD